MWTPTPSSDSSNSGATGTGSTITVIVAPTQGVLRYVPFVVNASVGDTIHYVWNANNHTVTKSSELQICNKTSDAPFASGTQNQGFTFDQLVNDTNPVFFYCGTPGHWYVYVVPSRFQLRLMNGAARRECLVSSTLPASRTTPTPPSLA